MAKAHVTSMTVCEVRKALRSAFVVRLIRRMRFSGVLSTILRASFGINPAVKGFPTRGMSYGHHAFLKPLCRSGVAAGGAGGGGPGIFLGTDVEKSRAATGVLGAA